MTRAVFLDIDGTLIDNHQRVPDSARRACQAAAAAGNVLLLASGRGAAEIYPQLWEFGITGLVGTNGSYIRLGEEVICDRRLNAAQVARVSRAVTARSGHYVWQCPDSLYVSDGYLDEFAVMANAATGSWGKYVDFIRPVIRQGMPASASKCTFWLPEGEGDQLCALSDSLDGQFDVVAGSVPLPRGVTGELMASGVSKATGIAAVSAHLGLDAAATVAVGDSANDIEMVRAAGVGIAMGNATAALKRVADWVSAPIDDDGLAKAFEYAGLI